MLTLLHTTFKVVFILIVGVLLIQIWLSRKSHIFSHEAVAQLTKKYAGMEPQKAFDSVVKNLRQQYPGHILHDEDRQWIFMNCGGWMGSMNLLHASLTEYVLIFGTAVNTSGNSGRYWANITDTLLSGTFRQWKEGEIESKMYYPGDTVYHDIGEAAAVQWTPGTWMVEYGRGFVPSTLGFALADTIFSTQDFVTLFYVLRIYIKALFLEASTTFAELIDFTAAPKHV